MRHEGIRMSATKTSFSVGRWNRNTSLPQPQRNIYWHRAVIRRIAIFTRATFCHNQKAFLLAFLQSKLPVNTKQYQHCTNVIQMFCICWAAGNGTFHSPLSVSSWHLLLNDFKHNLFCTMINYNKIWLYKMMDIIFIGAANGTWQHEMDIRCAANTKRDSSKQTW